MKNSIPLSGFSPCLRARLCADEGHGGFFIKRTQYKVVSITKHKPETKHGENKKSMRLEQTPHFRFTSYLSPQSLDLLKGQVLRIMRDKIDEPLVEPFLAYNPTSDEVFLHADYLLSEFSLPLDFDTLFFAFVGMQPGNVLSVPTNVSLPQMVVGRPSHKGSAAYQPLDLCRAFTGK